MAALIEDMERHRAVDEAAVTVRERDGRADPSGHRQVTASGFNAFKRRDEPAQARDDRRAEKAEAWLSWKRPARF